ncbi:UPF0481 protein At3g47200-like [Solanum dulcamara]|uniref:UPF0481 protein At3g47200-like n=1 Tax=Solanum dulcamara TaxID=45834 RepID=UPI0024865C2B|nr:UPF0481 protein At3g47200-like [Solanum dulcamara]XP_055827078.1 UPF0481 protein At3g47200-like [Solanum dulcamara]
MLAMGVEEATATVEKYPMQMVPLLMREESNEDYEPKVVSFGPYHHGKEKLKFVEDFKPDAVKMFIEDSTLGEHVFINAILSDINYIKGCYPKRFTSKYSDEQWAQMMFKDACVILNYIGPTKHEESSKRIRTINDHLGTAVYANIRRDMYLLENQIPLRILEILVCLRYQSYDRKTFINDMEKYSFRMFFNAESGNIEEPPNENNKLGQNALHLLEILRRVIVTGQDHDLITMDHSCCNVNVLINCLEKSCCKCCKNDGKENTHGLYAFRSVADLKSKGIHLRASGIRSLKGVRFGQTKLFHSAELKLPLLYVNMYTREFFKNMIAYELSPRVQESAWVKSVTDYVSFMKLLVATTEDVKELRQKKIIINSLGSDDDVLQVYKSLNTYEADNSSSYSIVKKGLEDHYNSTIKMWMANLITTYFSNPWTIIALVASLFLLCLDIVQTYYAVHPPKNGDDANQSSSPPGF